MVQWLRSMGFRAELSHWIQTPTAPINTSYYVTLGKLLTSLRLSFFSVKNRDVLIIVPASEGSARCMAYSETLRNTNTNIIIIPDKVRL